jgi:hypothetical protein
VRDTFLLCARKFESWQHVPCVVDGQRLTREQLAEQIWAVLSPEFVNCATPPTARE